MASVLENIDLSKLSKEEIADLFVLLKEEKKSRKGSGDTKLDGYYASVQKHVAALLVAGKKMHLVAGTNWEKVNEMLAPVQVDIFRDESEKAEIIERVYKGGRPRKTPISEPTEQNADLSADPFTEEKKSSKKK